MRTQRLITPTLHSLPPQKVAALQRETGPPWREMKESILTTIQETSDGEQAPGKIHALSCADLQDEQKKCLERNEEEWVRCWEEAVEQDGTMEVDVLEAFPIKRYKAAKTLVTKVQIQQPSREGRCAPRQSNLGMVISLVRFLLTRAHGNPQLRLSTFQR